MEAYVRVEKKREETPIEENEVRVMASSRMSNYITYALVLLQEKKLPSIVLKAMGRAINKTVTIAEIIKRRVPDLHQITEISSIDMTDVWEPIEEGLEKLEITRHVSVMTITLSSEVLDTSNPGYQPPIPIEEVHPQTSDFAGSDAQAGADLSAQPQDQDGAGGEGYYDYAAYDGGGGRSRGGRRGRGRGRGGRGRDGGGRGRDGGGRGRDGGGRGRDGGGRGRDGGGRGRGGEFRRGRGRGRDEFGYGPAGGQQPVTAE